MVKLKPLNKKQKEKYADSPVRRCSEDCFYFKNGGTGCRYYQQRNVRFGEVCMLHMVKMKQYAEAFSSGDTQVVKDDDAQITAMVMIPVKDMFQQVAIDGSTVEEPILDAKGAPEYIKDPDWDPTSGEPQRTVVAMRIKEHPLIGKAIQLAKSIGVNLAEFKQTPKSADEKAQVAGHIIVDEQIDLKKVVESQVAESEKFRAALRAGDEMTLEDPVYQQLIVSGDIVDDKDSSV